MMNAAQTLMLLLGAPAMTGAATAVETALTAGPAASSPLADYLVFAAPPAVMVMLLAVIFYIARSAPPGPARIAAAAGAGAAADLGSPSARAARRVGPADYALSDEDTAKIPSVVLPPEPEPTGGKQPVLVEPAEPAPAPKEEPAENKPAVEKKPAVAKKPGPEAKPAEPETPKPTAEKKPTPAKAGGLSVPKLAAPGPGSPAKTTPPANKTAPPKKTTPTAKPEPAKAKKTPAKQAPDAGVRTEPVAAPRAKPSEVKVAAPLARADDKPKEPKEQEKKKRKSLFEGLKATRGGFISKIGNLFRGKREVDDELLDELEELMYGADLGVRTTERLLDGLRSKLSGQALNDPEAVYGFLRQSTQEILQTEVPELDVTIAKPFVFMVVGVNGVGKTTTIGKMAARYVDSGKKVLLAAGDTFRAAAVEQLEIWGERVGMEVVKGKEKADPSSVLFDALKRAQEVEADVVLCDTAGRLHTKVPLMEQMEKVRRVMDKALPGAPHEVLLVLDATTGQNAIQQARMFLESLKVTSIALTKLDGTAKGGVVIGICDELNIPVRFIGIGEQIDDLRTFRAADFVEALFASDSQAA